ncbi:MAG: hypothetical protein GY859_16360 [Desulfobacterales bacterium]|nr:hypothetical protein [Desulfobacterales bacterium]
MNFIRCTIVVLALFMSFLTFQITGCGSSGGGGGSGVDVGSVVISSSATSIPADGFSSLSLTITVRDDTGGAVALGTSVKITTDLGTFSQNGSQALTLNTPDNTGKLVVSLIAGEEDGTATITVESNGVTQLLAVTFTPAVTDPGVTTALTLSANPTSILADGQSSTTITVSMSKTDGTAVGEGATVELTTDRGVFGATGGSKTVTLTTEDTSGTVITSLISSTDAGVAIITAKSNEVTQSMNVVFTSGSDFIVINLSSDATSLVADGVSSTAITVTLTQGGGGAVPVGTNVTITTNIGKFDMTGTQDVTLPTLDNSGTVRVSLISGQEPGSDVITATAGNVTQTMTITFVGVTDNYVINMSSALSELPADGFSSTAVSVEMTLSTGAPVEVGTQVTLKTSHGAFNVDGNKEIIVATADATGIVVVSLIAGETPAIADIDATIPNAVTQRLNITFLPAGNPGKPTGEGFGLSAEYLNIMGLDRSGLEDNITAYSADAYGNAVKDNIPIEFNLFFTGDSMVSRIVSTTQGFAVSKLVTTPNPVPQQGFAAVTAETEGDDTTRVTALAAAPFPDNNIMYAGTSGGGVYKSVNGGASWENFSRSSLNSRHGQNFMATYIKGHSGIAIDPDNPNTVYVGTGYSGRGNIYRSLDGGLNWNSNNVEEWYGLGVVGFHGGDAAVLTVLCDGDDDPGTDYPYVWAGTEGRGFIRAIDGRNFQPSGGAILSGPTPGDANVGDGQMGVTHLGFDAVPETWTATYTEIPSTSTIPIANIGNAGNGAMSEVAVSDSTITELWTVTYGVTMSGVGEVGTGSGILYDHSVTQPNDNIESFVVECIQATGPDGERAIFSVTSNLAGALPNATEGQTYDEANVSFTITRATLVGFDTDKVFTFSAHGSWSVFGTTTGPQNDATTGQYYYSISNQIGFIIMAGSTPFRSNDYFTFNTTGAYFYWLVFGTQSGFQQKLGQTGMHYYTDNFQMGFIIASGENTPFEPDDTFTFTTDVSTVNHGRTVWDIVKVPDTHGPTAILYAGTTVGVFKTVDAGTLWNETGNFVGDSIGDVALHPGANGNNDDILYAGTHQAGVWVSTNSGQSWLAYNDGIDMSAGARIRDLLVDTANNRLYAIAELGESSFGKGMVYLHGLNENGTMTDEPWQEIRSELPDPMWRPQVLASNNPLNTTQIYMGTEGINLYTADEGILTGEPVWRESKTGIDNTIMARMPILNSGDPELTVDISIVRCSPMITYRFTSYFEDVNGNPPVMGAAYNFVFKPKSGDGFTAQHVYGDEYWGPGTFHDPSRPATNNPFIEDVTPMSIGDAVTITATLSASDEAPGGADYLKIVEWLYDGSTCEQ